MLVRLEEPSPRIAHLFAMAMGGGTCSVSSYLFVRSQRTATVITRGATVAGMDESAVPRCSHGEPGRARVIVKRQRT